MKAVISPRVALEFRFPLSLRQLSSQTTTVLFTFKPQNKGLFRSQTAIASETEIELLQLKLEWSYSL